MARRSRTRGASGSGTKHRPRSVPVEASQEMELLLDEVAEAVMARDRERVGQAMELISVAPPVVPEVITQRLIGGRERAPGLMLTILVEIAPEQADVYLQRIVKARDAPDLVRYEAHRLIGWDLHRELKQRRSFLKKLHDPYGALAASTSNAGLNWPARIEAFSDVEAFLRALDPPERHAALDRIIGDAGWNAIPLLNGLIHAEDPEVQRRSIDALAGFRCSASIGPLRRLALTARNDDIRQHVEQVLERAAFDRTTAPTEAPTDSDEPMFPGSGLPPLESARVTRVDPDGEQSLWVTRKATGGFVDATNIYITGRSGLAEVTEYGPIPEDELEDEIYAMEGEIAPLTVIDLATARGLLAYAVDHFARKTDLAIPFVLELYAPMLHDTYPPEPDEPVVIPILDAAAFAGRTDLVERGAELLDHALFTEWAFTLDHLMTGIATGPLLEPDVPDDDLTRDLTHRLLNQPAREILDEALRRQAWLLQTNGSDDGRDIALALAAWLPDASDEDLADNEFITGLLQMTMSVAFTSFSGLGMIDESDDLNDGWFDAFDIDDDSIEAD
jgi:hypothetical protein